MHLKLLIEDSYLDSMCVEAVLIFPAGKKGCVGVWNMEDWSKVGYKKLADAPIASLAVSWDGKFLGL